MAWISFQNIEYMNTEHKGSSVGKRGTQGLIEAVFRMLKYHSKDRRDIVVRLTFCLGNLVSRKILFIQSDRFRANIKPFFWLRIISISFQVNILFSLLTPKAANCDESRIWLAKITDTTDFLPELLSRYIEALKKELNSLENQILEAGVAPNGKFNDEEQKQQQSKEEDNVDFGSSGTVEDTAIKIIRVFANVSINPEAGTSLALCENIVDTLLDICQLPLKNSAVTSDLSKYDNILLPTLATLNNLSFYPLVHQKETYKILKCFLHPEKRSRNATNEFSAAGITYHKDDSLYF